MSSFSVEKKIIWVLKSLRMRWAGHVESMGNRSGSHWVLMGHLMEIDHLEDPGVDGR
jgi:hypothetical protein